MAGFERYYDLRYPILTRIRPDGSGREALLSGLYRSGPSGRQTWFYFMRDPAVSPDGPRAGPRLGRPRPDEARTSSSQTFDIAGASCWPRSACPEQAPLGHQNPTWSPDGKYILYVKNGRAGGPRAADALALRGGDEEERRRSPGPATPTRSYSPDGRRIVATKTTSLGTDIVVLDARNGNELLRVTSNGQSWGGAWSPDGTQIAFLRPRRGRPSTCTSRRSSARPAAAWR